MGKVQKWQLAQYTTHSDIKPHSIQLVMVTTNGITENPVTPSLSAHLTNVFFQHLNNIIMSVSCNKVEKQAIANSIVIIVKTYGRIGDS